MSLLFFKCNRDHLDLHSFPTRRSSDLYESLVSREEMARVESTENYYRIPADTRDLNYAMYFTEGEQQISSLDDYTSDRKSTRLNSSHGYISYAVFCLKKKTTEFLMVPI